jgi:hypothetical protein
MNLRRLSDGPTRTKFILREFEGISASPRGHGGLSTSAGDQPQPAARLEGKAAPAVSFERNRTTDEQGLCHPSRAPGQGFDAYPAPAPVGLNPAPRLFSGPSGPMSFQGA